MHAGEPCGKRENWATLHDMCLHWSASHCCYLQESSPALLSISRHNTRVMTKHTTHDSMKKIHCIYSVPVIGTSVFASNFHFHFQFPFPFLIFPFAVFISFTLHFLALHVPQQLGSWESIVVTGVTSNSLTDFAHKLKIHMRQYFTVQFNIKWVYYSDTSCHWGVLWALAAINSDCLSKNTWLNLICGGWVLIGQFN